MIDSTDPTLLVVEDNDEDFEVLGWILTKTCDIDVSLLRCIDGDDALDFLHQTGEYVDHDPDLPDLVILDLNLPGTSGREVLTQIKQDNRLKTIPVIVFTTSSNPEDIEVCYQSGANGYMLKPVNLEQLKTSMRLFVDYWLKVTVLPSSM